MSQSKSVSEKELQSIEEIYKAASKWLEIYKASDLKKDADISASLPQVQATLQKAGLILEKFNQVKTTVETVADTVQKVTTLDASNPMDAIMKIEELWNGLNFANIAKGDFQLDKAQDILKQVNAFISTAESAISIIGKVAILTSVVDKVKEYISIAKTAINKLQLGLDLLEEYQSLLSKFNAFKDLFQQGGLSAFKLTKVTQDIKAFFESLNTFKKFISELSGAEKYTANLGEWSKTLTDLLKNAGGIIDGLVGDEDGNGLPDLYDKLNSEVNKFLATLPASFTGAIPQDVQDKLGQIRKDIESFLAKATQAGEKGKDFINKISSLSTILEKVINSAKGLSDAFKAKDWKGVYDEIQVLWKEIQALTGNLSINSNATDILSKIDSLKSLTDSWLGEFIPDKYKDILTQINEIKNIATALASIKNEVQTFINAVKNKDWAVVFQSLLKAYQNIANGKDLIPGSTIDDKLVAKAQDMLLQFEDFIKQVSPLQGSFPEQLKQAQEIVSNIKSYVAKGQELVTAVQNGDWKKIYEAIKDAYYNIDSISSFIPGTTVDDALIAKVQALKAQMEDFIKLKTGSDSGDLFKAIEDIKLLYSTVTNFAQKAQQILQDIKAGNWSAVFAQVKSAYMALSDVTGRLKGIDMNDPNAVAKLGLDDKILYKVKTLQDSIDDFIKKATGVASAAEFLHQVSTWKEELNGLLTVGKDIVNDFANRDIKNGLTKLVDAWNKIQQANDIFSGTNLDDKVLVEIQNLQAKVDEFLTTYSKGNVTSVQDILDKAKLIKGEVTKAISLFNVLKGKIQDKDFAGAIKLILEQWSSLNKNTNGFFAGTDVDDKIIAQSRELESKIQAFLTKYSGGALEGDLSTMVDQVKGYVGTIKTYINDAQFIFEALKNKDVNKVYEYLQKQWEIIKTKQGDIIPGTTIDTKLFEQVQNFEKTATEFISQKVNANTPEKQAVVLEWIGLAKQIMKYFLTKEPIPSLEHLKQDLVKVEVPALVRLDSAKESEILNDLSAGFNGPLKEKLIKALDKVTFEIADINEKLNVGKEAALKTQLETVKPIVDTRRYFDSIMKKQKVQAAILSTLGKIIETTITTLLVPAGPAAIAVSVGFKLLKGIDGLSDAASLIKTSNSTVNMAIQFGSSILKSRLSTANTEALGDLSQDLKKNYETLVEQKYREIAQVTNDMHTRIQALMTTLSKLDDTGIEMYKSEILAYANQWNSVKQQIEKVYLNTNSPKVAVDKLSDSTLKILYMDWLIQNKDISLVKEIVNDLNRLQITDAAGVDLTNKVGAKIARGLGQIFGKLLSFGESGKIETLRNYAKGNIAHVQKTEFTNNLPLLAMS